MGFFDIEHIAIQVGNYPISYVELIGTVFGFVSVYFASRANILTWPTGIVNEVFLFLLFFQVQLYADMFLQVYFFVVTLYGWYHWGKRSSAKRITTLSWKLRGWLIAAVVVGAVLAGLVFRNIHMWLPSYFPVPAAYPFADSLVMVMSIVATVLLARKKLESWLLWVAVDVISVVLYFQKEVYFLSMEYVLFLGLAAYGLYHWGKEMRHG